MPPVNQAAWLKARNARPLVVGPAPYTAPGPGQIVVKNHAVAINPVDWCLQVLGQFVLTFIKYPMVPGGDLAGEVVEVGKGVEGFHVGDRVMALVCSAAPDLAASHAAAQAEGAFQLYTVVRPLLAARIPAWMAYTDACVLPLTLATAAYGLFHPAFLGLDLPTVPARPLSSTKKVLVAGGASSVGCNGIQLATQAGYQVVTTASPKNFAYVKALGAAAVFDYRSKTLQHDLVQALAGGEVVGALAVGDGSVELCMNVLGRLPGSRRFVAMAGAVMVPPKVASFTGRASFIASTLWQGVRTSMAGRSTGVEAKFVDTKDLLQDDCVVGRDVFGQFLPAALAAQQYVTAPRTRVAGHGLEALQVAMDLQRNGVSAEKVVVTL
ncbi:zinc-binding protein oxidoreductase [Sporothrix brasiliensis 5110]|uniref:Zinc-binding protein oxidoreductase n=1 Tax=Sporothrix brasiliensis 5110 TaxID=1398154 RepID=A0A0C2IKV7_9PEZI|nr:zinc-binding protein oxidoreductase [Sporothrix brasiliensis 5110]KIH89726.1 zinc-binding protein oxidoreductase [Sporothrix brasiliensis 5110]